MKPVSQRLAALAVSATIAAGALIVPAQQAQAGDAFAAGVLGAVVGATLFAPAYPVYVAPAYPVYAAPPPVVYEEEVYDAPPPAYYGGRRPLAEVPPRVVTYNGAVAGGIEPWSPAWYDYCRSKYRSFDAQSGTFLGYDGQRRFCQAN